MTEERGYIIFFQVEYLKKNGLNRAEYNQVANYVYTQTEINIAIGKRSPMNISDMLKICSVVEEKPNMCIVDLNDYFQNLILRIIIPEETISTQ